MDFVSGLVKVLVCVVVSGTIGAYAHGGGGDDWNPLTPGLLEQADANDDLQVTLAELQAILPAVDEELFDEWDKNEDGVLTPADLPPPGEFEDENLYDLLIHIMSNADANDDQEVTFIEAHAFMPGLTLEMFLKLDKNHDGVLTGDDLPDDTSTGPIERILELLSQADANGDGEVTFAEAKAVFPSITENLFHELDRNADGVISESDLPPPPNGDDFERLLHLIELADADSSGDLTLAEVQAVKPEFTEQMFNELDRNDDGLLSPLDLPPSGDDPIERLLDLIHDMDANDDGEVTLEEIQAELPEFTQEKFDRLDFNGDGVLSVEDLPAPDPDDHIERLFELLHRADANGDGEVTLAELQAIIPEFTQEAFDRLDKNEDGVLSRDDVPNELPSGPCEELKELLREADENEDGQVTVQEFKAEFPDASAEAFERLDANNDGVISREDAPAFPCDPREILHRVLEHADANQDGQVTFEELSAVVPDLTQEQFDTLDRNGDGVITIDDKPEDPVDPLKRLIRLLQEADADNNGEVTFEELSAVAPELTQEQFDALDKNDDGVISPADLPSPPEPGDYIRDILEEADADDNDLVTFDELIVVLPNLTQEQFDQLDQNGDGFISIDDKPEDPVPPTDDLREQLIKALIAADANQDGQLDFAEIADAFPGAPTALLEAIDTNDDWIITRDEILAALGESFDDRRLIDDHDVDCDGDTDASDVQNCINQALDILSDLLPADLNGNSNVDASDIQQIINGALGL